MQVLLLTICLFLFRRGTAVEPNRLSAALKAVLGHLRPQDSVHHRSTKSSIGKRCSDHLACVWPIPGVAADNIVLVDGQVHVDLSSNVKKSIEEMNQFYGAKANHLPAVQVQVAAGKIEWIAGPQIVASDTYSRHCKWDNPTSPANKANTKAVFIFPWEINNAFHTLNDNIMSVLSDVILDYLHAPSEIADLPYTLYQFKYTPQGGNDASAGKFKEYQFSQSTRAKATQPSLLYELLPLLFGAQNIKSAGDILKNGPHCIKHLSWSVAKKPIYKDTLIDLRRAVYDVLQHVLHSYLIESGSTNPVFSLNHYNPTIAGVSSVSQLMTHKPSNTHKPRVIIVSRANSVEPARKLNKQNELLLAHRFSQQGFDAEVCCDFTVVNTVEKLIEKFINVDICIGVHGAGLANCVLAKPGMTMVELQTHHNYGSLLFQKIAHMASGHHIFHDIRVANKMTSIPELRQGYVLSEAQISDIIDLSKRMYLHTQRGHVSAYNQHQGIITSTKKSCADLYTNTLITRNNAVLSSFHSKPTYGHGACSANVYTTAPPDSELIIADYAHSTIFLRPDTNAKQVGYYVKSILTSDFIIGNLTAWRKVSTTGPVIGKKKVIKNREMDAVLKRNERTYWIELNPSLKPYTKESILGPTENTTASECTSLHYHQFRQLILRPKDKLYQYCDFEPILRKRTGQYDNMLLSAFV